MGWKKKGMIFQTDGKEDWNRTHVQIPTIEIMNDNSMRIYYSTRDERCRSYTSYFDVSIKDPTQTLYVHNKPILPLGDHGAFDDCGVMPSSIVHYGNETYLYYIGWNVRNTVPYQLSLGLAMASKGTDDFQKAYEGPILDRSQYEGYLVTTGFVIQNETLEKWQMWYTSGTGWEEVDGKMEPLYCVKYSESDDGKIWRKENPIAIPYQNDHECIARPSVIIEDGIYKMWYTYRDIVNYRTDKNQAYKIGYAESIDGINWERMDEQSGITTSDEGWDSEMIAYPCVVSNQGKKYMFYNGNGFGQSGIGYAVWED